MPSSWPVRDVDDEYGIDMEVEVLRDRQATGMLFQVQLKATDSEHLEDARFIRVKRDTIAYWRAMDLLVLVVLYEAPTRRLFACWAHGISMNVRPGRVPGETMSIPFSDDSEIDDTYHERLLDELIAVRAFRTRRVPLPIPVRVMFDESKAAFRENEFLTRLRQLAERSRVVEWQDMDGSSSASLYLGGGEVRFDLPAKLSTAVLYTTTPQDTNTALRVAADALVMASLTLCAVGMDRDAVALAASVRAESTISDSPQVIEALFESYVSQGRAKEALSLLLPLMESSDQGLQTFADILIRPLVQLNGHNLDDTDRELVQASLRRRALADAGTPRAGRNWYTIAQFNRRHPNFQEALEAMKRALECDPGYVNRHYYYRDLAGIQYELGEYEESARNCSRALELGADASTAFLLADVLMLAGEFARARRAAEDAILTRNLATGLCAYRWM
jgi:tetratricopeptide (TPR) repeat protein